jgi:transmembrane sensor
MGTESANRLTKLLNNYINNRCSEAEINEVISIVNDPEKRLLINNYMSEMWSDFNTDAELDTEHSDKLLSKINSRKMIKTRIISVSGKKDWYRKIASVAAIIICLIGLVFINGSIRLSLFRNKMITVENYTSGIKKIELPDSSIVWLNAASKLVYPEKFKGGKREVSMTGEACFDVKKDKKKSFIVRSGAIITKVLGTKFNITAYAGEEFVVSVIRGKVQVSDTKNTTTQLTENQRVTWLPASGISQVQMTGIASDTAWMQRILVFDNKNLGEVAHIIERWYHVKITFANEKLKNCELSGKHFKTSLPSILETIRFILGINYHHEKDMIVMDGNGCE